MVTAALNGLPRRRMRTGDGPALRSQPGQVLHGRPLTGLPLGANLDKYEGNVAIVGLMVATDSGGRQRGWLTFRMCDTSASNGPAPRS
jgi:hypothetical protein